MQSINFYTQFILDPQLLANGYTLIKNYLLQSQSNRQQTLINILIPSPPIITIVGRVYPSDVFPTLQQQQKIATRNYLIQLLVKTVNEQGTQSKNSQNLLQLIKKIHNEQGYEQWVALYSKLIQSITVKEFGSLIINILQSSDNRISVLSIHLFVYVIQNYQKYQLSLNQIMEIMFYCVKSFAHMHKTEDQVLEKYYEPYQKMLVQFIWNNLRSTPISMKYGLKLLTVLYGEMNLAESQDEISHQNVTKLGELGLEICQQYIKIISSSSYKSSDLEQEQLQQQNKSDESIHTNISFIIYQLFELYDIVLNNQQYQINVIPIILTGLLAAVPSVLDLATWRKNTVQYLISLQSQYDRTLRNRANDFITMLVEEHWKKQENMITLVQYFSRVAIACQKQTQSQSLKTLENYIQQQLNNKFELFGQFVAYEQAAYFVLSSQISTLFKKQKHKELLSFIMKRYTQSSCILIKISSAFLCINEMKQPPEKQISSFILNIINTDQTLYNAQNIGLALALSRGLGKICYSQPILLSQQIPIQFMNLLVSYLKNSPNKPDLDQTHIILEMLLKLTDCNEANKNILNQIINNELQVYMINNYMYDGLLSNIVVTLLEKYPHKEIVVGIFNAVLAGGITDQKYAQLAVKWIKSGNLNIDHSHIEILLEKYKENRRDLINPLIKLYLDTLLINGLKPPTNSNLLPLLNSNPNQSWLVSMLQCGILSNLVQKLIQTISTITYKITSQYQLECKLCLPYYLGIYQTQKMFETVKSEGNLFNNFLEKLYKYAQLFQGEHLKIITSIFYLKITQFDKSKKEMTISLIKSYGKLQSSEWKDQQFQENDQQNQQQIIQQLIGGKLSNQFMETQLKNIFKDLAWNAELVNQKLLNLQQQLC